MQRSNIEIPQAPSGCCYDDEATFFEDTKHRVASKNKLLVAIAICMVFMSGQIVGGIISNSLAIQTDAAHMLSDILSFAIYLFSLWASSWKATPRYTYGFFRIEILGALVSVLITWIVTGMLCYTAIDRIIHGTEGHDVQGWVMVLIGSLEVCLNIFLAPVCIQSAYIHMMGDLIQSIGVLIGGIVIWLKPKLRIIDFIFTFVFALLDLKTTLTMVRKIFGVLMQRVPHGIDSAVLGQDLCETVDGVDAVHQLHIRSLTSGKVILSLIQHVKQEYKISNVTVQVELSEDVNQGS
ncbi:hypothetical protein MKW98_014483 [Papaver atlanticum]|uniref:Cation efflux protein transmembrane domain-containing protein n=1 Tax=Papaver atlanticum TaxID=357466 RepID=A0AAD4SJ69_9MAGN|nr:hypothetical protein MKW98_014483 [Papaver atlanticum]